MDKKNSNEVPAFITKDGSEIRELLAHRNSCIRLQSLAEARLAAGGSTQEHYHVRTEEIYYITAGRGRVRVGAEELEVHCGDAIAIPPGARHKIWNTGAEALRFLCCCAPAYEHEDTVMTEAAPEATQKSQGNPKSEYRNPKQSTKISNRKNEQNKREIF